jgi:hypothetical protein
MSTNRSILELLTAALIPLSVIVKALAVILTIFFGH